MAASASLTTPTDRVPLLPPTPPKTGDAAITITENSTTYIPDRPPHRRWFDCASWSQRFAGLGTLASGGTLVAFLLTQNWPGVAAMSVTTLGGAFATYSLKDITALKDMDEYTASLAQRTVDLAAQTGLLGEEIKKLSGIRDQLQARIAELEPQIDRLTAANTVHKEQNEAVAKTTNELKLSVDGFQDVMKDKEQKLAETAKAYQETTGELARVKDEFGVQIDQLSRTNTAQSEEIERQKVGYETLQKDLSSKIGQFKNKNELLSATEKRLSEEVGGLTTRLETLDKEMAEKVVSLDKIAASFAANSKKVKELWSICDALRKENASLADSSASLGASAAEVKKTAAALDVDEQQLAKEVNTLDQGNAQLTGSLEKLKLYHIQLQREREELEDLRKTIAAESLILEKQRTELQVGLEKLALDQAALEEEQKLLKKGLEELDQIQVKANLAEKEFTDAITEGSHKVGRPPRVPAHKRSLSLTSEVLR